LGELDARLLRFMRTCGHFPALERKVRLFSTLGEHGALWLAIGAGGWLADRRRRSCWSKAMVAVVNAYGLNTAIKLIVRRRRPQLSGLPPLASAPTQLSFPSAHTATAFAGALAYSRLGLPKAPLYGLAVATGLSRSYLGLHHPSDVLAGAALGTAVASMLAPTTAVASTRVPTTAVAAVLVAPAPGAATPGAATTERAR
jgi:membrane-associated phospholipid phosphatase